MKAKALNMIGLGLAVACLSIAPQTQAAKGGIPGKPGGEDPPPPPPITYQNIHLNFSGWYWSSLNDTGMLAGIFSTYDDPFDCYGGRVFPNITRTSSVIDIFPEDIDVLADVDVSNNPTFMLNNHGQAVGVLNDGVSNAKLWLEDGTMVDLGVTSEGIGSSSYDINDSGMVVVKNHGNSVCSMIVPDDVDGDGFVDTWFVDSDADGVNDLLYPLVEGLTPSAINETGQIVFSEGYLLTPDYTDSDGDGNPWFADDNGDGISDLLYALTSLGETIVANDINDLGQVVGSSNGRAVMWEVVNSVETVTDLGAFSRHTKELVAVGINNAGQIVGTCMEKKSLEDFMIHEGQMYNLDDLGAGVYIVEGINNNGWILGQHGIAIPKDQLPW